MQKRLIWRTMKMKYSKMHLPGLYSTLPRYHFISAAGLAFETIHVKVRSWFSRTSTFALWLNPCISIDDGGAVNCYFIIVLYLGTEIVCKFTFKDMYEKATK